MFGKYLNRKYGIITHIYHWAIKCSAGNHSWLINSDGEAHPCGICTSPEYGLAASKAGCFVYQPLNILHVDDCKKIFDSDYFKSVRHYLYDKKNYEKFVVCKDCEYFGDVCMPCPLYSTEGPAYELETCKVEECEWVIDKLNQFYKEQSCAIPSYLFDYSKEHIDENGKLCVSIPKKDLEFKITGVGQLLWRMINGKTSVLEMVDYLGQNYSDCPEQRIIQRDVVDFLCTLRDVNILDLR